MGNYEVYGSVVGPVGTNCYFLVNADTSECLVIDPGDEAGRLCDALDKKQLKPVAILLTHGHFDHAGACAALSERFDIPVVACDRERETLSDPAYNLSGGMGGGSCAYHADIFASDDEIIEFAGIKIRVIHTPGHTPGSCCYYVTDGDILFSGDTLFFESVGRTDFLGGSQSEIVRSIRSRLFELADDTIVYTGHGMPTDIGFEKQNNPFV